MYNGKIMLFVFLSTLCCGTLCFISPVRNPRGYFWSILSSWVRSTVPDAEEPKREEGNERAWIFSVSSTVRHILYMILLNLNHPWKVEMSPSWQARKRRLGCVEHPAENLTHGIFTPSLRVSTVEIFHPETLFSGSD